MLPVQYSDLKFHELNAHLNHLLSIQTDQPTAEIEFTDSGITFPLKIIQYKTKPAVLEFRIRSGSVGRENILALDKHLENKGYELRRRKSHKLRLLSAINVHLPCNTYLTGVEMVKLAKEVAEFLDIKKTTRISISYPMGYEKTGLPGKFNYRDFMAQLGYKIGWQLGLINRWFKSFFT